MDTGRDVKQGEVLHFDASGITNYGLESSACTLKTNAYPQADASGDRHSLGHCDARFDAKATLPGSPVGELIGRVGGGAWFAIGAASDVKMPTAGRLYLAHNRLPSLGGGGYSVATSTPTSDPCGTPRTYSDVPPSSFFYQAVTTLTEKGYVSGYADCTFRPFSSMTPGGFMRLLVLAMNVETVYDSSAAQIFSDVPQEEPYFTYVQTASRVHLAAGYDCGGSSAEPCDGLHRPFFRPLADIKRGQAVKAAIKATGWALANPTTATFEDVSRANPYYEFVETAVAHHVFSGYPCGGPGEPCDSSNRPYFRPLAVMTRAQSAVAIYRLLTAT